MRIPLVMGVLFTASMLLASCSAAQTAALPKTTTGVLVKAQHPFDMNHTFCDVCRDISGGMQGGKAMPSDHQGRMNSSCKDCHQSAIPAVAIPTPTPSPTPSPTPTPTPMPAPSPTIPTDRILISYWTNTAQQIGTLNAGASNVYLVEDITIENQGSSKATIKTIFFQLRQDGSQSVKQVDWDATAALDRQLQDTVLDSGGKTTGRLSFKVDRSTSTQYGLVYGSGIYGTDANTRYALLVVDPLPPLPTPAPQPTYNAYLSATMTISGFVYSVGYGLWKAPTNM